MSTVNPQSVIPLWVNSWNSNFYNSLVEKENWSYINQTYASWEPLFTQLANALNSYKAFNRQAEITNFFFGAYGYLALNKVYGTDDSLVNSFDANNIYNLNNLIAVTISRPINYYNDAVIDPSGQQPAPTSALMTADVATVNLATSVESALIKNLSTAGESTVQSLQFTLLFKDKIPVGTVNKPVMNTLFFTTLHWSNVFANLNVGTLTPP